MVLQVEGYRNVSTLSCRPLVFTSYQAFSKNKKRCGTSLLALPLLCEVLGNMCIAIVCKPGCDDMNFEVNLNFLIKPFFLHERKLVSKI